jgi:hypothetical protein
MDKVKVNDVGLFQTISSLGKTLYDIAHGVQNPEAKHRLMDLYDALMSLKRQASDLEDEVRGLREQLRFKSEDFAFRSPFYYEKAHPDRPVCPKCFVANQQVAPMGEPYRATGIWRRCLVCGNTIEVEREAPSGFRSPRSNSWMG